MSGSQSEALAGFERGERPRKGIEQTELCHEFARKKNPNKNSVDVRVTLRPSDQLYANAAGFRNAATPLEAV